MMHLARDNCVEADDFAAAKRQIGLWGIWLLGAERVPRKKAVEFGLTAGEGLNGVGSVQLFDAKQIRYGSLLGSKTEGSRNSRSSCACRAKAEG
jgi:hypothetical protein